MAAHVQCGLTPPLPTHPTEAHAHQGRDNSGTFITEPWVGTMARPPLLTPPPPLLTPPPPPPPPPPAGMAGSMEGVAKEYQLCVPPYFALILRAFSVIEGIALQVRKGAGQIEG